MKKAAGVSILVVGLSLAAWRTPADEPRVQEPVLPAPPAQPPRPAPNIELPPGFVAELVYQVGLRDRHRRQELIHELRDTDGVLHVSLVVHSELSEV